MERTSVRVISSVFAVLCVVCALSPTAAKPASVADGKTINTAVVITEADDAAAIKAEDAWLEQHYPGYTKRGQAVMPEKGRYYDAIEVSSSQSSEPFKVYFDITKAHAALVDLFR